MPEQQAHNSYQAKAFHVAEGGGIGRNFGDTVGMFFFFFFRNSWRTTNQLKLVGHIIPIFSILHFTLFFGGAWRV